MGFLTRKRDGQAFPTDSRSSGKEYRKDYSESFEANKSNPKPSFGTKHDTKQDIGSITTKATDKDTQQYDGNVARKNYNRYSRNNNDKMDKQFRKSDKKARKKQKKAEKKRTKQDEKLKKSEIDEQLKYTKDEGKKEYVADKKDEDEDRETIATFEGNR